MVFPSGDQVGAASMAEEKVRRVLIPRARSNTQMLKVGVPGAAMEAASLRPSGERFGVTK